MHRVFPFVIPLAVILLVVGVVSAIGELLLAVGREPAVFTALGLTLGVGLVATLLSLRAAKLPPVALPGPIVETSTRRMDLGAGYIVGQFVAIFVAMLALLIVVLALKQR